LTAPPPWRPDTARAAVRDLRTDLTGRWRCDAAHARALLSGGDEEHLYADVQESCPAAADPDRGM
jgi:hypothetical protein